MLIASSAMWFAAGSAAASAATVKQQGYIPMADGTQLEYTVDLPAATGRFPVAMVYDGYCEGTGGTSCNEPTDGAALLAGGAPRGGLRGARRQRPGHELLDGHVQRLQLPGVARRRGGGRVGRAPGVVERARRPVRRLVPGDHVGRRGGRAAPAPRRGRPVPGE